MCWLAKGLIAACVGYLPSPGETVTVKRACIYNYSKLTRGAATRAPMNTKSNTGLNHDIR
jgi:hypothetical protein